MLLAKESILRHLNMLVESPFGIGPPAADSSSSVRVMGIGVLLGRSGVRTLLMVKSRIVEHSFALETVRMNGLRPTGQIITVREWRELRRRD